MDIIYVLVPLSLVLLSGAIAIFFWAVRSGQFDDMDSPASRILFDDDEQGHDAENNNQEQHRD
ncbi:hypothetical protein GCM10011297_02260 [Bacterioplanes sanyensis]|uniref:cbb3-type cytochrome oxidase assembly protein CcoS n=1 Tax=Bacterioplanes sanyensis TaxID=1249553 RepID=UPI0016747F52|nr:cbb3-type cytochrome oxidase assembly protein CcoS [Bacterioplanes sanyensis]GGY32872.1 hypothetical protein GCM10011297_02260 [Bacterioplanes sanyensis]